MSLSELHDVADRLRDGERGRIAWDKFGCQLTVQRTKRQRARSILSRFIRRAILKETRFISYRDDFTTVKRVAEL